MCFAIHIDSVAGQGQEAVEKRREELVNYTSCLTTQQ